MTNLTRVDLPVGEIEKNTENPNKMSSRAFDLLVDNIQRTGITENIVVRKLDNGRYRVVSGHHRFDAACYLGFETVPSTVIDDPAFDDEAETLQLLRMNAIKGKLDPEKFVQIYDKFASLYSDADIQDMFGFSDEAEWKKLVNATAKSLPKDLQKKFKEAAEEIKTVDGLAKLLNTLFTKYGDTAPYGYMVFEYGKEMNLWLRMSKKTFGHVELIGDFCIQNNRTIDDFFAVLFEAVAKGDIPEISQRVLDTKPERKMPGVKVMPTEDNLAKAGF